MGYTFIADFSEYGTGKEHICDEQGVLCGAKLNANFNYQTVFEDGENYEQIRKKRTFEQIKEENESYCKRCLKTLNNL